LSGDLTLVQSLAHCERIIRDHARSFYFAARFLPPVTRQDVFALYAFYRTVDDLVDCRPAGRAPATVVNQLNIWRHCIRSNAPRQDFHPVFPALRAVTEKYAIPCNYLLEVLDGVERDLYPNHLRTFDELRHYCYQVAGSVGLVTAHVLGAGGDAALDRACTLGIAMQLTNVLRDVGEDLERGMIYLPAEEMSRFGYSAARLGERRVDADFVGLMRMQIARARDYYRTGLEGIGLLPRGMRFPILLAARMYGGIMREIERSGYDVFRLRAHTGLPEKLWLAGQSYRELKWSPRTGSAGYRGSRGSG
jgi:phytoene synthase